MELAVDLVMFPKMGNLTRDDLVEVCRPNLLVRHPVQLIFIVHFLEKSSINNLVFSLLSIDMRKIIFLILSCDKYELFKKKKGTYPTFQNNVGMH